MDDDDDFFDSRPTSNDKTNSDDIDDPFDEKIEEKWKKEIFIGQIKTIKGGLEALLL